MLEKNQIYREYKKIVGKIVVVLSPTGSGWIFVARK